MGVISSMSLLLIVRIPGRTVFFIVVLVWFALLVFGEGQLRRLKRSKQTILPILLATVLSYTSLISIVEWKFLNWPFILLLGISVFLLFQSIVTSEKGLFTIEQKPYRRIMVLIWTLNGYAMITTVFALGLFFPGIPFWILAVVGGILLGLISFMVWKMYSKLDFRKGLVWIFLMSFLIIELVWVMHLLPFGYLVSGFLVAWLWYILQLFMRFHFGPKGVIWKRQIWFIVSNAVLYSFLMIFFVRWV